MVMPKKSYLERREPRGYSIKRKVVIAFEKKCGELGIDNTSSMVEQLMLEFLKTERDESKKEN